MRKISNILIISILLIFGATVKLSAQSNEKEIVILSVNDMHGHIEGMPRLGYVVDSLRNIYPKLLVFSAGDNWTGCVFNDFYPGHPNLPMIECMNEIGFDLTAVGNHAFDKGTAGLADFQDNVNFPIICANADFSKVPELHIKPYHFIENQGVRICVLGLVETYSDGHPGTLKKCIKDITFTDPKETVNNYLYLDNQCDVFLLLSHCSERGDFPIAKKYPELDAIIGGHSHHKYIKRKSHGILCTQAKSYLSYANILKITVKNGKITKKSAESISLDKNLNKNAKLKEKVDQYFENEILTRKITNLISPLDDRYKIGCLLADSYREIAKTELAFHNFGAIRCDSFNKSVLRVADIIDFCPFENRLKTCNMKGSDIVKFLTDFSTKDRGATYVSGLKYTIDYNLDRYGNPHFSNAKVYLESGEPIDLTKTYSVVMTEYPVTYASDLMTDIKNLDVICYDVSIEYLRNHHDIDMSGFDRMKLNKKNRIFKEKKTKKIKKNQPSEIVILSVNDTHGHIENMPAFAYVVDSLRNIYPNLILVSAGDNRTGNIYNDKNPKCSNLPMITLMNDLDFTVCELGNHEFDGNIDGLKYFVENTNFPIICANADFSCYPEISKMIKPYYKITQNINGQDVSVIFLGMIETSNYGFPSAHRDNMKDVGFVDANRKIVDYLHLKDSCDVFVLLDHCGIEVDSIFARKFPEFDLIIGGHSHDLLVNQHKSGVLYTQSKKNLNNATVTKLQVLNGNVVAKESQAIDITKIKKTNADIQKKVDEFCNVPEFNRIVGHSKAILSSKNELGAFMADALRHLANTDIAISNPGGVRFKSMKSTDFRVVDVLNLDPFNNSIVIMEITGNQLEEFLNLASTNDYSPCHVSGITYSIEHYIGDDNIDHFVNAKAFLEDGQPIDHEKTYSVAINSYMKAWANEMGISTKEIGQGTNEAEFKYLKDNHTIDYQGVNRYKSTLIEKTK